MTIVEMTVSIAILSILATAALNLMNSAQQRVRVTSRETESLDGARTTLARITSDVRDALKFYEDLDCPISTCLTIATQDQALGSVIDVRYRYDPAARILYRSSGARHPLTGAYQMAGSEAPAATNIVNGASAVFCRKSPCTVPSERAVEVILVVNAEPTRPGQRVTLRTYATPRNQA